MNSRKRETTGEIVIDAMSVGSCLVWLRGATPLIYNSMSRKAKGDLLYPKGRKTAADKAQTLKHDPITEYRESVYRRVGNGATRLTFPASAVKSCMCNAALETPGAKKAQIGRLVWTMGDVVDLYGVPRLFMSVVRSADIGKTPDIRTRAIVSQWCCAVQINFVLPTMNETTVARLLATAGLVIGLGDYRQEKGKGNYGQFEVSSASECKAIIAAGGIAEQDNALENPEPYDIESQQLLEWYLDERTKRGWHAEGASAMVAQGNARPSKRGRKVA